jgi:hypothetical protein
MHIGERFGQLKATPTPRGEMGLARDSMESSGKGNPFKTKTATFTVAIYVSK